MITEKEITCMRQVAQNKFDELRKDNVKDFTLMTREAMKAAGEYLLKSRNIT